MRLKTFKGPDLATALERARAELGPDALVLATSEIAGTLGLPAVEVTVGVDHAPSRASSITAPARIAPDATPRSVDPTPAAAAAPHPALRAAVDSLMRSGVTRDLALRFATIAARDLDRRADADGVAAAAVGALGSLVPFHGERGRRPLFVVGPPGAGKTTAVARLAAREARGAVFASADRCRVGAREQAEGFARLVRAPLAPIGGADDLAELLRDGAARGRVLVDTPGVGRSDASRLARLVELRAVAGEADVAVLLPAGLHRDEARRVVERFEPLAPTCVALSKVDDGGRLGDLFSAAVATGLPLAFATDGHGVRDIETLTPGALAGLLLRDGSEERTA